MPTVSFYSLHRLALLVCASCFMAANTLGQPPTPEPPDPAAVQSLIEQLESARFSERAAAAAQLQKLGQAANQPLERVVLQGSPEASKRALEILSKNYRSNSPALSSSAKESLRRLADREQHPKSKAAQQILEPKVQLENRPGTQPQLLRPANPVQIRKQIQIQMRSVNGQREIKVIENGKEFRFKDGDGSITVERPDEKGQLKKTQYKDAKELEAKDPEAFKKYKQYGQNGGGGGIKIQMGIGGGFGRPFGVRPLNDPFGPNPFGQPQRPRRAEPDSQNRTPRGDAPKPDNKPVKPKLKNVIEV